MHYAIVRHHQWWFTISITLWILANDWLSTHCSQIVSYVNCMDLVFVPSTWSDPTIVTLLKLHRFLKDVTLLKLHRFLKIIRKQQDICAWMWARAEEVASCLASTFVFVFIFVFIFLFVFVFVFVFLFVFVFVFGWITRAEEVAPPWHPHLSKTLWVARYFPTLHGYNLLEIYLFIPLSIFNGILWKVRTHQQILLKPHLSWNAWHKQLHDLHVTPHLHSYTGPT